MVLWLCGIEVLGSEVSSGEFEGEEEVFKAGGKRSETKIGVTQPWPWTRGAGYVVMTHTIQNQQSTI